MVHGQSYTHGKCSCGAYLPPLLDDNGWGITECPNPECDKWFDTQAYARAGGRFNNNGTCSCEKCIK